MSDVSRRKFLLSTGAVATSAAAVAAPKLIETLGSGADQAPVVNPSHPAPSEPVMAYVHDAASGEVTVMSGTLETTYRDPALVKRLLRAAPGTGPLIDGGEVNVIAP